jgi:catechol 2,3-dioxygenase-like lactoylglutathione lyase family enzyme
MTTIISRRVALSTLGALVTSAYLPRVSWAQAATSPTVVPVPLPLKLTSLVHHVGMSVRDVIASATFYSHVFGGNNVIGEKEPFLRYFINLEPGRVAIGKVGTLGSTGKTVPLIDHFCVDAGSYDDPAWRARLAAEGLQYLASGVFNDIDAIPVQVAGGEGGESLSAGEVTDLAPLYTGEPLLRTRGYDHVMLRVRDVGKTAAFWQKMFGFSATAPAGGVAWISDGNLRLGWRQIAGDEQPGVEHFAIRAATFSARKLTRALAQLGASQISFDRRGVFRFADPDGIKVQVWPL